MPFFSNSSRSLVNSTTHGGAPPSTRMNAPVIGGISSVGAVGCGKARAQGLAQARGAPGSPGHGGVWATAADWKEQNGEDEDARTCCHDVAALSSLAGWPPHLSGKAIAKLMRNHHK
jgi:hypothetical protein